MIDLGLKSLGVLCLVAGILNTPAIGQIAPKDTVRKSWFVDIDEAVVTGEREAVKAQDAMRVVRKLDLGEVVYGTSQTLREALRLQNGVRLSQDLALGTGISLNGLGGLNVQILLDGVPLVGRLGGNIDLGQIRLDNIDRIEIVEGPLAVEYGTHSLAGTIQLISKRGGTPETTLTSSVQYESVGDYTQSAGLRWKGKRANTTLNLSHHAFDGWSKNDPTLDWISDFVADSSRVSTWNPKRQGQVNLQTTWAGDSWTLTPQIMAMGERIVNRGVPRGPYKDVAFDDMYQTLRLLPSLRAKSYGEDGLRWDILASWQHFTRRKEGTVVDLTTLESTPQGPQQQDTTRVVAAMTRGTGHMVLSDRTSLRTGWDINHETYNSGRIEQGQKTMLDAAAFALVTQTWLNLEAQYGLRLANNSAFTAPPPLPSANILVKRGEHRFRGAYARGFRAPTLKELHFRFVDVNHQIFGNDSLTAESSNYAEVSWSWSNKSREFRGRAFVNSVKDRISLVDHLDDTFRYENISTFYAEGFAIDFNQRFDLWTLQGGFLLTGRKQQLSADGEQSETLYTPEWTASVTLNLSEALSLNANCKHNGSQPRYVSDGDEGIVLRKSPPYTMIDFQAGWQWKNESRIQVGVSNLLDVTNVDIVGGGGAHSSGNSWIAWGRSYVVTVSHQFQFQKR